MTIVRFALLALFLLAPAAEAAEGLGVSKQQVIDIIVASGLIPREDAEAQSRDKGNIEIRGPRDRDKSAGPGYAKIDLSGSPRNLAKIRIEFGLLGHHNEEYFALAGTLLSTLVPTLGEPPRWTLQRPNARKASGWAIQFVNEAGYGGYSSYFFLLRRMAGKQFLFVSPGSPFPSMLVVPDLGSSVDLYRRPSPANPELVAIATDFENARYHAALDRLVPLAEAGDPDAQALLGEVYYVGRGVERNEETARKWFERAAAKNNANGQFGMGAIARIKDRSTGNTQAVDWLRKAAIQGHPQAQFLLAGHYSRGGGHERSEAAKWCGVSARLGNVMGQFCMIRQPSAGRGTPEGSQEAHFWLFVARRSYPALEGFWQDLEQKDVPGRLSPAQRNEIERRVESWRPFTFDEIKRRCGGEVDCPAELVAAMKDGK